MIVRKRSIKLEAESKPYANVRPQRGVGRRKQGNNPTYTDLQAECDSPPLILGGESRFIDCLGVNEDTVKPWGIPRNKCRVLII